MLGLEATRESIGVTSTNLRMERGARRLNGLLLRGKARRTELGSGQKTSQSRWDKSLLFMLKRKKGKEEIRFDAQCSFYQRIRM